MSGRRTSQRIKYKELHETGEKVYKEDTLFTVLENSRMEGKYLNSCIEDINDHFTENQISEVDSPEDLKLSISVISRLRTRFRECVVAFKLILNDPKCQCLH